MISEKDLVKGCLANDRIAQKYLFEQYSKQLFSTAYRIVADFDMAQDVLQEAFIEVFRNIKSYNSKAPLFFWIRTIVVRKAIRMLKTQKNFEMLEHDTATTQFNDEFTAQDLDRAIMQLPDSCRAVFIMIEVEGYKHREVSEILKISEGTSKSQLHYSKQILQKLLKEIHDGK